MKNKGFTLIELLVVIAIVALLSSIVLASLRGANNKGANNSIRVELNQVRVQMNLDYAAGGTYLNLCNGAKEIAILDRASMTAVGNTTTDGCGDSATQFAAWAPLRSPEIVGGVTFNYWCIDSTNLSKGETNAPAAGTVACP